MPDRQSPRSRLAAATRRRIAALALARTHRYGLRTITTPGLVAPIPDEHGNHRPNIYAPTTKTVVPRRTRSKSHSASWRYMRTQPCEAKPPMEAELYVPWIPTAPTDRPIQRVPSGFPGPGGIGEEPEAQPVFGGYHQGLRCFETIRKRPRGVGYDGWPTATRKTRASRIPRRFRPRYSQRLREPRRMTTTGPKPLRSTCGLSLRVRRMRGPRSCRLSSLRTTRRAYERRSLRPGRAFETCGRRLRFRKRLEFRGA